MFHHWFAQPAASEDGTDAVFDGCALSGVRDTLKWATGRRDRLANDNSPDGPDDRFDGSVQHLRSAVLTYPVHSQADRFISFGVKAAAAWLLGETDTEPVDANGYGQMRGLGTKAG